MQNWQQHLTNVISIFQRGQNLETNMQFKKLFHRDLAPSELADKLQVAEDIKKLYTKAYRMTEVLKETQDEDNQADTEHLGQMAESGVRRMSDVLKILNSKAKKWGLEERLPSFPPHPDTVQSLEPMFDQSEADDNTPFSQKYERDTYANSDGLRQEIKRSLKALSDIVDYMEPSSLLKIRRKLNKLISR